MRGSVPIKKFKMDMQQSAKFVWPKTLPENLHDKENEIFRSGLPCEVVFRPKSWIPADNLNLLQTGNEAEHVPGPKPDKIKIQFFFKKSNPPQCMITT